MKEYTFSGTRYMTRGITNDTPAVLVMYLWGLIEERKKNKDIPMDYFQVFELKTERLNNKERLIITHHQEVPPCKEIHSISSYTKTTGKIFVIDDIDHVTMLWSHEY